MWSFSWVVIGMAESRASVYFREKGRMNILQALKVYAVSQKSQI